MKNSAVDILISAADAISSRADQRDDKNGNRSMQRTVKTFNALTGHSLTECDGWIFMAFVKAARSREGRHVIDDYMDGAAYMALAGESIDTEDQSE